MNIVILINRCQSKSLESFVIMYLLIPTVLISDFFTGDTFLAAVLERLTGRRWKASHKGVSNTLQSVFYTITHAKKFDSGKAGGRKRCFNVILT